jgi:1-acyl-sn-glycerol-3-phosphate acyltransferase
VAKDIGMTASMGYRLVRVMIRVLLGVFYHRVDVIGRERIPLRGPLIVAANHHNAGVDAMLIVATFPRPIMVLAKAPLFRHPLVGPYLKVMSAVHERLLAERRMLVEELTALAGLVPDAVRRGRSARER